MREHLPAFLRHLADRSPRTAATYSAITEAFFAYVETNSAARSPTRADVEAFLARPRKDGGRRSAAGRNQELAALRAFGKFAMRELGWPSLPTDGVPFLREPPRDPAVLTAPELRQIFTAAAEEPSAWRRSRNLALVAILSQAGLRVHEVVALDLAQVDIPSATLVAVLGKGGTVHDLPLNAASLALVLEYITRRAEHAPANQPALFVSREGRLSVRAVQSIVAGLRKRVGSAKKISPHTFRHSAATLALTMGSDLSTVAELLRHSDLNTTRRYLHLVDERRREAVRRLAAAIPPELVPGPALPASDPAEVEANPKHGLDAQHDLDEAA